MERKALKWMDVPAGCEPAGYAWLISEFGLEVPPRPRVTFVATRSRRRVEQLLEDRSVIILPPPYAPGEAVADHLEFALKHEGVDLLVLARLFAVAAERVGVEITDWVRARPSSQFARRAWCLFELLSGVRLALTASTAKAYVPLLDPARYYTAIPRPLKRYRVADNLLGDARFCPTVRRTAALDRLTALGLSEEATRLVASYDPELLRRAVDYLYTKETRASFKLEGEVPDARRAHRFVDALRRMSLPERLDEGELTRLQNLIVSEAAADPGYRTEEVYVGEQLDLVRQHIHYVAPRAEDVPGLMDGWLECLARFQQSPIDPVIAAAVVSFGFVFIHPFTDGNGRIHRALIHHVLARSGFVPAGTLLPISAVLLRNRGDYDRALESVSRPLMRYVAYEEESDGRIRITNATADLYRYLDYTHLAERLGEWTQRTIREDLRQELTFVERYQRARVQIEAIVDLPDRLLNLFIQLVLGNGGRLSKAKRRLFDRLSDDRIAELERVVSDAFGDLVKAK